MPRKRPAAPCRSTSSDLELTYDGSTQTVGVRFTNLPMPQNAIIERAYIQFNVDELGSTATSLTIRGELPASGSAATFTSTARNISSRISAASPTVSWSPPAWNIVHLAGPDQATPDLSAIVQAIVDLPNWQSGNAAAFIITGTGKRTAEAYEGSPAYAPILRVEYREPGDVTLGSWRELGLKFNGLEVGVDTVSQRLFVPLGAWFRLAGQFHSCGYVQPRGPGLLAVGSSRLSSPPVVADESARKSVGP